MSIDILEPYILSLRAHWLSLLNKHGVISFRAYFKNQNFYNCLSFNKSNKTIIVHRESFGL